MDDLEIPAFLRRQPKETKMTTTPEKKKRTVTELPKSIRDRDGSPIILDELTLIELAGIQRGLQDDLSDVGNKQLELRAVNSEIRKRAK